MVFAARGSMVMAKAAHTFAARTLAMDGALPKFSASIAGAAEHVEKLTCGQHDAAGAAADELHPVYVLHDHEAGGEIDPRRESGRA